LSLLVGQHREPACEEVLGTSRSLEEEDADDHQGGNQWLRPGRARVHAHRAGPLANLLAFDSTFGRLGHTVDYTDRSLTVGGASIAVLSERDPAGIDWHALGADVVIEATGKFRTRQRGPAPAPRSRRGPWCAAPGCGPAAAPAAAGPATWSWVRVVPFMIHLTWIGSACVVQVPSPPVRLARADLWHRGDLRP